MPTLWARRGGRRDGEAVRVIAAFGLLLWMAAGGQLYEWWPPLCFAYFALTAVVLVVAMVKGGRI